jgi:cobalt-zinc-cadmium efflux system outer membrane protein
LWLRPVRIASARFENERTCEQLVQSGLDLMRDVRQAYADLVLAHGQLVVAEEGANLRGRIAAMAEARLKAGDASPPEAAAARIDALQANQDLVRVVYEVSLAEERLRNLLGISECRAPLVLQTLPLPAVHLEAEALAAEAVQCRPDALAAKQAVEAAEERVRLARRIWFRCFGILDANAGGNISHQIGPGFRLSIPIFNWGQGGIARAEADLEQAVRQQATLHNQIFLDVYLALTQYRQARAELEYLEERVRPEAEKAIGRADLAFKEGQTSYLIVLQTTHQLLSNQLRAAQLRANLRRSLAELERSVGRRLAAIAMPSCNQQPMPGMKSENSDAKETPS